MDLQWNEADFMVEKKIRSTNQLSTNVAELKKKREYHLL